MQMPKMDGSEFITVLKSNPATDSIPIVIVAGKQSGGAVSEQRADFTICKDIGIEQQLAEALAVVPAAMPIGTGSDTST